MSDISKTLHSKKLFSKRFVQVLCCLIVLWMYGIHQLGNSPEKREPMSNLGLYEFNYLIANDICKEDIYLLILVHSAANHFEHRQLIRSAWGDPGRDLPKIKVAFLLAMADEFQKDIEKENELHRDIIQGNFVDSYRNLTYKHVMGLSWASVNCTRTRYLIKMDDDIFMDIYQLLDYIHSRLQYYDLKNHIACYFQNSMPVVRDPVSKWFVSRTEFGSDTFHDYCSGWAYLTTTSVAHRLVAAAKTLPYFWVDDVHLTGTVAKVANVSRIRLNPLYALETDGLVDWTRSSKNLKWDRIFAPTWGDLTLSGKAHKKALKCHKTKCRCCYKPMTTPKPTTVAMRGVAQIMPFHISR